MLDKLFDKQLGKVHLVVNTESDNDPDTSYLGEWCAFRQPNTADEKLVDRRTGYVLDHHGIWRDERGRIVPAPENLNERGREYRFTFHNNGHDKLVYALRDHQRLANLGQTWDYVGIVARVYLNGADIGTASVWGFENDWDRDSEKYIRSEARGIAQEAIAEARAWLASIKAS